MEQVSIKDNFKNTIIILKKLNTFNYFFERVKNILLLRTWD